MQSLNFLYPLDFARTIWYDIGKTETGVRAMINMTTDEVIEYLQNDESNDDFSFRGDDFVPSDKFRNSWYHGDDEPEYELDGVSAIAIPAMYKMYIIKAIKTAREYGGNVYLLRGRATNADECNHDPQELLMVEHEIVCMVTA